MADKFQNGAVIILTSVASKKDLCSPPPANGGVLGKGTGGLFARWVVHRDGPNVRLAKLTDGKAFLRVHNDHLDAQGGQGPFTLFHVKEHKGHPNMVSLASVAHAGQHVGILENGDAKHPSKTKTGKHGQFIVKVVPPPLWVNGSVIRLTSVATGKNLRIQANGHVDGHGEMGEFAQFVVHDAGHGGAIRLSSVADRKKFLRIQPDGDLDGLGGEGEWTLLKPIKKGKAGLFVLQSVKNPAWHVGVLPNGHAKNGKMTGDGEHGQFKVTRV
jgi:hypothetical protein